MSCILARFLLKYKPICEKKTGTGWRVVVAPALLEDESGMLDIPFVRANNKYFIDVDATCA